MIFFSRITNMLILPIFSTQFEIGWHLTGAIPLFSAPPGCMQNLALRTTMVCLEQHYPVLLHGPLK